MEDTTAQTYLQQAQAGDKAAFEALRELLIPRLTQFVRRLVGAGPNVDDVVQDTIIALYYNLVDLNPPEKLLPFVYRVARNRCYDLLRKQKRHQQVTLDAILPPIDERPRPEEHTYWRILADQVAVAMDALPEPQRQALILYAEEGFNLEEIAEIMSVPRGTVKSRLHHARKTLRRILQVESGPVFLDGNERRATLYLGKDPNCKTYP